MLTGKASPAVLDVVYVAAFLGLVLALGVQTVKNVIADLRRSDAEIVATLLRPRHTRLPRALLCAIVGLGIGLFISEAPVDLTGIAFNAMLIGLGSGAVARLLGSRRALITTLVPFVVGLLGGLVGVA